ncbi:MAG: hypothetical protein LBQ79_11575 [Deltaproteobacteria bacterium]|jgi:hypothetical protein|nr:hypothetical protein [Deltaproteobacteria bacterium]
MSTIVRVKDYLTSHELARVEVNPQTIQEISDLFSEIKDGAQYMADDFNILQFEDKLQNTMDSTRRKILLQCGDTISGINDRVLIKHYRDQYSRLGINLETHRKYSCDLLTICGSIRFERHVLRPITKDDREALLSLENRKTVVPLDKFMKIDNLPFKATPKAMLEIAWWATDQLSYQRATDILQNVFKWDICQETVRKISNYIGKLVTDFDIMNADKLWNLFWNNQLTLGPQSIDGTLYIMIDGAMLHTKEKDENGTKWRENKLGIIFSSMHMKPKNVESEKFNFDILKREYVDYFGSVDQFQVLLLYAAIRNGYGSHTKTVLVTDGATWISNMQKTVFPDAIHILDIWHVIEHLYAFGKIYFKYDEEKYQPWVEEMKEKLVCNEHMDVIAEVQNMTKKFKEKNFKGLTREEMSKIKNLPEYLCENKKKINYHEFRSQGLYIGSGHIESGNRTVAQDRLKRPGMTWNIDTGQCLLTLRAKKESKLWNSDVEKVVLSHFNL